MGILHIELFENIDRKLSTIKLKGL